VGFTLLDIFGYRTVNGYLMLFVKLPSVELNEDEKAGALSTHKELLKNKTVILFFIGVFCYVGTEQGVANWTSNS